MIRSVIIDDEKRSREALKGLLERYCPGVRIIDQASSATEGLMMIKNNSPDLVFLDIEMPGENGFEMLSRIDKVDFKIIFITAYDKYALKAIKFSAHDYLLKPIDVDELKTAIGKLSNSSEDLNLYKDQFEILMSHLKKDKERKKIAVADNEGLIFIFIDEIVRCESDGNYTYFVLNDNRKLTATRTLGDFEELFSDDNFFRVHRSHLINIKYIQKYIRGEGGMVKMSDGSEVEVSRRRKNDFLEKINKL